MEVDDGHEGGELPPTDVEFSVHIPLNLCVNGGRYGTTDGSGVDERVAYHAEKNLVTNTILVSFLLHNWL